MANPAKRYYNSHYNPPQTPPQSHPVSSYLARGNSENSTVDTKGRIALAALGALFVVGSTLTGVFHSQIADWASNHPFAFTSLAAGTGCLLMLGAGYILFIRNHRLEKEELEERNYKQHIAKLLSISFLVITAILPCLSEGCHNFVTTDGSLAALVAGGLLAGGLGFYGFFYRHEKNEEDDMVEEDYVVVKPPTSCPESLAKTQSAASLPAAAPPAQPPLGALMSRKTFIKPSSHVDSRNSGSLTQRQHRSASDPGLTRSPSSALSREADKFEDDVYGVPHDKDYGFDEEREVI